MTVPRVGCDEDDCLEYYRLVVSLGLMVPLFMALLALFLLNRGRICSLLHGSSGLGMWWVVGGGCWVLSGLSSRQAVFAREHHERFLL